MAGLQQTTTRRAAAALALACLALIAAAPPATGSMTIGQLPSGSPSPHDCPAGDYLQPSVTGGNLYIAKQAGRITSWSTYSTGSGTYTFKVFRRTRDPDAFQAIAHAPIQTLSAGLVTFPVDIAVRSGDMIGFHQQTVGSGSCTYSVPGDAVLQAGSDLPDGATGQFGRVNDVRLNLAANLVPANDFQVTGISRNRRQGTAVLTVEVPNPGVVARAAKGVRKPRVSKAVAGASSVSFGVAPVGKLERRLVRKGKASIRVDLTFAPTGGDPNTQTLVVKLKLRGHKKAG